MNKREWLLIFLVLFLFIYSGGGDVDAKSMHPTKSGGLEPGIKLTMPTVDKEWIVGKYYTSEHKSIIIVLNDTSENIHLKEREEFCNYLLQYFDVLNMDFRGHGDSSGDFTGGNVEILDLQAALQFIEPKKYDHIGVIGYGFGGYMAVQGAAFLDVIDRVMIINPPYQLYHKESDKFNQKNLNLFVRVGRIFVQRLFGIRSSNDMFDQTRPIKPYLEGMKQPLLIMYIEGNTKVTEEEIRLIHKNAQSPKAIYIIQEDQMQNSDNKIIHSRAADWFSTL